MGKELFLNVTQTDLKFIGEGNEHVVFGIHNSDSVVRFRKFCPGENTSRDDFLQRVMNDITFVNYVARPLAGSLLIDEAHLIAVDPCLLEKVMADIKGMRKEKRLCKTANPYGIGILTRNVATAFINRQEAKKMKLVNILSLNSETDGSFKIFSRSLSIDDTCKVEEPSAILPQLPDHILVPQPSRSGGTGVDSESLVNSNPESLVKSTTVGSIRTGNESHSLIESTRSQNESHPSVKSTEHESTLQPRESQSYCVVGVGAANNGTTSAAVAATDNAPPLISCGKDKNLSTDPNLANDVSQPETDQENPWMQFHRDLHGEEEKMKDRIPELICVELKPKQGFLEPTYSGKGLLCRYCLKQHVKFNSNIESAISRYCPLDLFSGEEVLMSRALEHLFVSPQNNLKIFSNGKSVKDFNRYKHISDVLLRILSHELYQPGKRNNHVESQPTTNESHKSSQLETYESLEATDVADESASNDRSSDGPVALSSVPAPRSALSKQSILGRVLSAQYTGNLSEMQSSLLYKELCRRDQDGYREEISQFKYLTEDVGDKQCRSSPEIKGTDCSLQQPLQFPVEGVPCEKWNGTIELLDSDSLIQLVQEGLVSMSFKDLSIMILVQGPFTDISPPESTNNESPFWIADPNDEQSYYKCQVTLVDLALKNSQKILEHEVALKELETILVDLKSIGKQPLCCTL